VRDFLLGLAGSGASRRTSFTKNRLGWIVRTQLNQETLRQRFYPWASRIVSVHGGSGTYFVRPNSRYFLRVLRPTSSWDSLGETLRACPVREDRLRRLRPFLRPAANLKSGQGKERLIFGLALRLVEEALTGGNSQKLRTHLASDFDRLWASVPLFSVNLSPLDVQVLEILCDSVRRPSDCMDETQAIGERKDERQPR
jgi:hypothetical protein